MSRLGSVFRNPHEGRVRAGWRLALQMLATVSLMFGLRRLAALVIDHEPSADAPLAVFVVAGAQMLLAIVGGVALAGRFLDRRSFSDFGLKIDRGWWTDFFFGLVLGGALVGTVVGVGLAAGWLRIVETFHTGPGRSFPGSILVFALLFVCVGFAEEMMSRGYQIKNLSEGLRSSRLDDRAAILIAWVASSTVFGLLHATNPHATVISTLNIVVAGIALGVGYVMTGQLAIPIGVHISWNFCLGNVFGLPVSGRGAPSEIATFLAVERSGPDLWTGGAFGPEAGLLGLVATTGGLLATIAWIRLRGRPVALHAPLASPPPGCAVRITTS